MAGRRPCQFDYEASLFIAGLACLMIEALKPHMQHILHILHMPPMPVVKQVGHRKSLGEN